MEQRQKQRTHPSEGAGEAAEPGEGGEPKVVGDVAGAKRCPP